MSGPLLLTVAGMLVAVAGVSAMIDAALTSVSPTRVVELAREGNPQAGALAGVLRGLSAHVSLLVLLRLASELSATVLVAFVAVHWWGLGWAAGGFTVGVMTIASFVLAGVGPRTLGLQHPYAVALRFAAPLRALGRALGPLARLLIIVGNVITPGKGYQEGPFATERQVRELLDLAEQRGDVETDERQMVHSVFELGDTLVREVMVPRTDVVWVEQSKTAGQALMLALRSGFSRIPVIGEGVDDVVGVVYLKDLVTRLRDPALDKAPVSEVMREAEFVPEFKPIDELLREMQARRIHIAIVVDEYGGTAGLVTIEDIVEEIVGEITDEYDPERPLVEKIDDVIMRVTARLPVEDLAELFDVTIDVDEVETVGGLMAQALGRVPIPGAVVEVSGLQLEAASVGGRRNRIDTVLVRKVESSPGSRPSTA